MLYTGHVSTTKRFKTSMQFIDKANEPIKKIQKQTTQKLGTIKNKIISDIKNPTQVVEKPITRKTTAKEPSLV